MKLGRTSKTVVRHRTCGMAIAAALTLGAGSMSMAEEPGRGIIAPYEIAYLKFIIDHHYSALRITELAAGTDLTREAPLSADAGTSPTPNTAMTPAKAQSDNIKSLARRNNRMQREEILTAKGFLRDWYHIEYSPRLSRSGQAQVALLEKTPAGPAFDHSFLEVFSRHHAMALSPSAQCMVSVELTHDTLQRYCSGIVHSQTNEILEMRDLLCNNFSLCDYQPLGGLKGRHSGKDGIPANEIHDFDQPDNS